jgi:hypothetical protein
MKLIKISIALLFLSFQVFATEPVLTTEVTNKISNQVKFVTEKFSLTVLQIDRLTAVFTGLEQKRAFINASTEVNAQEKELNEKHVKESKINSLKGLIGVEKFALLTEAEIKTLAN